MTAWSEIERRVEQRAAGRCEYCRMHQTLQGATFHVEHVIPRARGGTSDLDNLAWACPSCNLSKSNRIEAPVPGGNEIVPLFNPRHDEWGVHFCWNSYQIIGITSIGRAIVEMLGLNHNRRIKIRQAEALFGLFPPE